LVKNTLAVKMLDIIFSFGLSFILALVLIPCVIKTALHRNIVDKADERKAHTGVVPSLGGIGIFVSFTLVLLLTIPTEQFETFRYILMALGVIFLLGAQDDLRPLTPLAKLIGQLIAVYVLVFWADLRITQFYGLFGIEAIPYALSTFISVLFYLFRGEWCNIGFFEVQHYAS
jgi:UDP-N-acetylmuramyl pentapeptide phosphotransferase/UDP-N-acetylglucosamine-1-phosphate transferase